LLDVGVGTGRIGLPLASLGYRYTGVDIAEKMLAQLEQKALARGWQAGGQAWGRWAGEDPARVCPVRRFTHSEPAAMLAW
jgi:SAM-dependent methyltransferase